MVALAFRKGLSRFARFRSSFNLLKNTWLMWRSYLLSELVFLSLLLCAVVILYVNSLDGAFIWDDRAAVVKNSDVHGITSLASLLVHDFWGTDITRIDSHKSYRPITVATFRFDYSNYALDAYGYHLTNVFIYVLTCVCVYAVVGQWLSVRGSRVAALLFAFHPLHVEAVSSIVGRADALCGLFYCAALYSYTLGVRLSATNPRDVLTVAALGLGMFFAGLATLSKEIGFTVLGVFVAVEMAEQLKHTLVCNSNSNSNHEEGAINEHGVLCQTVVPYKYSIAKSAELLASTLSQCARSTICSVHMFVIIGVAVLYFKFRAELHGENMLYKWTMMENHVLFLPTLYERSLSYAQYHYLYLYKLLDPAELCFDYGYACIPTVHSIYDVANLRPLIAYGAVLSLFAGTLQYMRINLLVGIVLLLVPLMPALNVLVPVGTLLAERLLFIPSIGFCMIVGEMVSVDLECAVDKLLSYTLHKEKTAKATLATVVRSTEPKSFEMQRTKAVRFQSLTTSNSPKKRGNAPAQAPSMTTSLNPLLVVKPTILTRNLCINAFYVLFFLPLLCVWGTRVVSRNRDWHDEYSLYKSGLAVCPRSLKVLTNFAVLAMARGEYDHALEVALRATDIYPEQVAALINTGVAFQKLGRFAESVDQFERCLRVDARQSKAAGYLGVSYYHWAGTQTTGDARELLLGEALKYLLQAVDRGFQAPAFLHLAGCTLLEAGRTEDAIPYFEAALRQSANYASYYGAARSVPILLEDDIQPSATLNQLGSAYRALQRFDEAADAYQRGLQISPDDLPMLTNLGNLYREMGQTDLARSLMQSAIAQAGEHPPPALLNNLGLLELNGGNFRIALELFQQALVCLQTGANGGSYELNSGGASAHETILLNIKKAREFGVL